MVNISNIRKNLEFINGHEGLNDKELFYIFQNITPIFGSNLEHIKPNSVFVVSKDKKVYDEMKNKCFCCGCKEFEIPYKNQTIFLAFDY